MDKKVFYTVSKCGLGVGSTVEMKVIFDHILESGMADEIHHWYGDNQLRDYTTNWQIEKLSCNCYIWCVITIINDFNG
jgi:hypothetical protein